MGKLLAFGTRPTYNPANPKLTRFVICARATVRTANGFRKALDSSLTRFVVKVLLSIDGILFL